MNNKPIQLVREDFAVALSNLVNETPLPAFIKIDILNGMSTSLSVVAEQEYAQAKTYWEEQKKKPEDENADNASQEE